MKSLEDERTIKVSGLTFIYSLKLVRSNTEFDIYHLVVRHIFASYNFIVSFDGFTWTDEEGKAESKNLYYFVKRIILLNI